MRFNLAASTALVGVIGLASCREPTQITLEITTDIPCSTVATNGGVEIRVGSPASVESALAQQVVATTCVAGRIGSLVIVPSDAVDDQVAIFVTVGATTQTATCSRQSPKGCVLGRRVLRYVPHTRLLLPIELSESCIDKACAPDETCNKGQCQSAAVACDGSGLCNVPPPGDAGVDAAPDAPACPLPKVQCGGVCVDVATSSTNCGACNIACNGQCTSGICRLLTTSALVDQPGATGCLVTAGNPPEVYWTLRPLQSPAGVYRVDRNGSSTPPLAVEQPITADLGGIAAGNGRVVYGVTTSGLAAIHSFQTATHLFNANLTGLINAGHVANVAVSPGAPDRACWTTLTDGVVRCTGWNQSVAVVVLNPGEAAALGPSVVAVGLAAAIYAVDATAGTTSAGAPALVAPVRGVAARSDSNVFYYTEGPALRVLTASALPSLASTPLDTLTHPGLGIAYDALTEAVYWVEDDTGATSIHSRPLAVNGTQRTLATNQKGANCIAVDDQAVYWLSNGVPYKMPK